MEALTYVLFAVAVGLAVWAARPLEVRRVFLPVGYLAEKRGRVRKKSPLFRLLEWPIRVGARYSAERPWSDSLGRLEKDLQRAGSPGALTPDEYLGVMFLVGLMASIWIGSATAAARGSPHLLYSLIGFAVGIWFARRWLKGAGKRRVIQFERRLPYAIDLLTLSIEAGLNFELALDRLVTRGSPDDPVIEEFRQVQYERSLGRPRMESLRAMASRVQSEDLDSVVLAIEQGEDLGVPLRESLAMQADVIRLKRSQRAEKLAQEAGIKMVFPVILILFSVLLVLFGGTIVKVVTGKFW